jgi:hypothetical protein
MNQAAADAAGTSKGIGDRAQPAGCAP